MIYPTERKPRYVSVKWLRYWAVSDRSKPLFATSIVGTFKTRREARLAARLANKEAKQGV